jgi:hypothetical protein
LGCAHAEQHKSVHSIAVSRVIVSTNAAKARSGCGTLAGGGTITANVSNTNGTVIPEGSGRLLSIDGDYSQTNGTLDINLAGPNPGIDYDVLSITGTATLGGTLDVALVNGFGYAPGQTFDILSAGSIAGGFTSINLPGGGGSFNPDGSFINGLYNLTYTSTQVIVTAIPEPTSVGATLLGCGLLARRRRRR